MPASPIPYCHFCGKSQHHVFTLIAGPAVYICDECIDLAADIVAEQRITHRKMVAGDIYYSRIMEEGDLYG